MLKLAVIALMAIVIVVGVFYANEQGMFDGATSFLDQMSTVGEGLGGFAIANAGIPNPWCC